MAEGAQQTPAKQILVPRSPVAITGMKLSTPAQPRFSSIHAQAHSAGVMSPVNQNGCFEFDRIIKAGSVLKRTRKTKVRILYHINRHILTSAAMEANLHRLAP